MTETTMRSVSVCWPSEFVAPVKAMSEWIHTHTQRGYINAEDAAPFVQSLPEFWREPARVMACCGYYASADGWMKEWVESKSETDYTTPDLVSNPKNECPHCHWGFASPSILMQHIREKP